MVHRGTDLWYTYGGGAERNATVDCGGAPPADAAADYCDGGFCLFHLPSDPCEHRDVSARHADRLSNLVEWLERFKRGMVPSGYSTLAGFNCELDPRPEAHGWKGWMPFCEGVVAAAAGADGADPDDPDAAGWSDGGGEPEAPTASSSATGAMQAQAHEDASFLRRPVWKFEGDKATPATPLWLESSGGVVLPAEDL